MPLLPVPPNPNWQQIQNGLDAAGDEIRTNRGLVIAERAKEKAAQQAARDAGKSQRDAEANYNAWLAAIRRLTT